MRLQKSNKQYKLGSFMNKSLILSTSLLGMNIFFNENWIFEKYSSLFLLFM